MLAMEMENAKEYCTLKQRYYQENANLFTKLGLWRRAWLQLLHLWTTEIYNEEGWPWLGDGLDYQEQKMVYKFLINRRLTR